MPRRCNQAAQEHHQRRNEPLAQRALEGLEQYFTLLINIHSGSADDDIVRNGLNTSSAGVSITTAGAIASKSGNSYN